MPFFAPLGNPSFWSEIVSLNVAGLTNLDFPLNFATHLFHKFLFNVQLSAAGGAKTIDQRFSIDNGATFDATANYLWHRSTQTSGAPTYNGTNSAGTASIALVSSANPSNWVQLEVTFSRPISNGANRFHYVYCDGVHETGAGIPVNATLFGFYRNANEATNVRFFGNAAFLSGSVRHIGSN